MIPEKIDCHFLLFEVNDGLTISLKDIFETEKASFFSCVSFQFQQHLK